MQVKSVGTLSDISFDALILPLGGQDLLHQVPLDDPQVYTALSEHAFSGRNEELFHLTRMSGGKLQHLFLVGLGENPTRESAFYAVSLACRELAQMGVHSVAVAAERLSEAVLGALCECCVICGYRFDKYKSAPDAAYPDKFFFLRQDAERAEPVLREALVRGEATLRARDLINEPPTVMTPARLADDISALLKDTDVRVTVYGKEEIEQIGLSAFLEVGKGSLAEPKLIVMEYTGAPEGSKRLGLVGKGLTYDSGGYSLQSSPFMETMQHDMSGGAAVACALRAAAELRLKVNVTGVIAACENKLSATAYVPGDVIPSMSGKYIEVNNTDAEGRITLADAVTYLKTRHEVSAIVDIATLTDAIQTALGNRRAGLFSNCPTLAKAVADAGDSAMEPVWELPCDEHIRHVLDSRVAHLKNSAMGSDVGGYATVGALFIREFVGDTPWAHLDLGGVAWTKEACYSYTKGGVGFGARLLLDLMKQTEVGLW